MFYAPAERRALHALPYLGLDEVVGRTEGTVNNWFLPDGLGSTLGITDAHGTLQI